MAYKDKDPDLDLDLPESEEEEESGTPRLVMVTVFVLLGLGALWLLYAKYQGSGSRLSVAALEQQLPIDKAKIADERDKVFEMTTQLQELKEAIRLGRVKDKKAAVAEYNKLASEQNAQREKVLMLTNDYNQKIAKLEELR